MMFQGTPGDARGVLIVVSATMITTIGIVFSLTVLSCFPTKADCRRIRGVPVFDGYTRMVARLMGSLAVLRSVSIPKGYRDFGFGSLRAVAPKNCPDVSG
ncbi:hypothetical protein [Mycobacterium tuberculosis]|uniref:hypothetical protein n=1 Tax=Mycobacterium tuberculosis TaxID=1773 RepID=UPI001F296E7F|nr:hypothetical protein [Mycobacterium tuberculosis]